MFLQPEPVIIIIIIPIAVRRPVALQVIRLAHHAERGREGRERRENISHSEHQGSKEEEDGGHHGGGHHGGGHPLGAV